MTLYPDLSDVKDQTTSSQSSRLLPVYFRLLFELVNFQNLQKMNKRDILKQFNIYYEGTEIQISVTKWAETVKIYKIVFIDKNTKKLSSKPRTVTTFFLLWLVTWSELKHLIIAIPHRSCHAIGLLGMRTRTQSKWIFWRSSLDYGSAYSILMNEVEKKCIKSQ